MELALVWFKDGTDCVPGVGTTAFKRKLTMAEVLARLSYKVGFRQHVRRDICWKVRLGACIIVCLGLLREYRLFADDNIDLWLKDVSMPSRADRRIGYATDLNPDN